MSLLRTFLVLAVTTGAAAPAAAQVLTTDSWRWRSPALQSSNALGLSVGRGAQPVYCGSVLFPCDPGLVQGANLSLTGKAALVGNLNVYGRLGISQGRGAQAAGLPVGSLTEGAESMVGVGVSWDFTPRASATLGWDSYDFRTGAGRDPVRFTNIGLQWRY